MEQLTDLKAILHSKRANIYYLEKCRVMQKDGRVLYLTGAKDKKQYWNIPIANTTVILLGTGTSITQMAVRMLAQAGVLIGFTGGGGTPLIVGNEVEWLTPQSEYRPTEYVQNWLSFWSDDQKRLHIAKQLQLQRIAYLQRVWAKDKELHNHGFNPNDPDIEHAINTFIQKMNACDKAAKLLPIEAEFTKKLYKCAGQRTGLTNFVRDHSGETEADALLNHGNYLAYGLAATTLWVLGIPHGFAVMHGKTRRGALVFDIADLVKDSLILPWAFICAKERATDNQFREQCLQNFTKHQALDFMFDVVKDLSEEGKQL